MANQPLGASVVFESKPKALFEFTIRKGSLTGWCVYTPGPAQFGPTAMGDDAFFSTEKEMLEWLAKKLGGDAGASS
jgi:hypothetical protein